LASEVNKYWLAAKKFLAVEAFFSFSNDMFRTNFNPSLRMFFAE
jgi:hypothetical protein